MHQPILCFESVFKTYAVHGMASRYAIRSVDLQVAGGETVSIMGRSGSGKSTLLNLAAGLDTASAGRITAFGQNLGSLSDRDRTALRRDNIGIVFQFFHLLSHLNVLENVALPDLIAGTRRAVYEPRARALLENVELGERAQDRIDTLSGGEMQRVALCRALLRRPRLILADEPTGNLDDASGRRVMDLLLAMAGEGEAALIYVTHDAGLAQLASRRWRLHSGVLEPA